jgi:phospholipid/cholesterol/gamma-HCH transport system permease protein
MVHFLGIVLVVVLSPSTYNRVNRAATSKYIYTSTWQVLPWFTALTALLSLVLIRIVVVSAQSYGLSQFALEMVVRVLVLELIPLSAAMFVALRSGMVFNAGAMTPPPQAIKPQHKPKRRLGLHWVVSISMERLRSELVLRVLAEAFSVLAMATVSSVIALVLAYITVYGLSPWGLQFYTYSVARVFDLTVTLGFALKTLFFSLAVAVVPMAASLEAAQETATYSTVQPGAVRLFLVLLLIDAASLAVKYI